ncbi:MAG: phosphoglucosamine mutase [Bacteroidales bacterium]
MTLIKSISGIRGTIGGVPRENLTPDDVVKFVSAYGRWLKEDVQKDRLTVIVGRDARPSGEMVERLVLGTLAGMGIDAVTIGLATTPTTEMEVIRQEADGGIILTASHNPKQWNALKLLNNRGEFISAADGAKLLAYVEEGSFTYAQVDELGSLKTETEALDYHIKAIKALSLVDVEAIAKARFKVVVDGVNSVGGVAIPALLRSLGVTQVHELNCIPDGQFAHNPEPIPENLTGISAAMKTQKADVGIVVDPDVDRLALIDENGNMFGEEYTLVAVADYVLKHTPGNTVSNLSSSLALRDITQKHNQQYTAAAVGEVNVVEKMKDTNAIIGGEGNGGIIYPALHAGRDALVGVALFLTYLAKEKISVSALRKRYPHYEIIKKKMPLSANVDVDRVLANVAKAYEQYEVNTIDGVKIVFDKEWVHLRKSNTEPIIRIYAESKSREAAEKLADQIIQKVNALK